MSLSPDLEKVKEIFEHVSIDTFIRYFEEFKNNKGVRFNNKIYEAFENNKEPWRQKSKSTRASKGKSIFNQKLELSALDYIVNYANPNRIEDDVLKKAKKLFLEYSLRP